jgi:hypothetical protein
VMVEPPELTSRPACEIARLRGSDCPSTGSRETGLRARRRVFCENLLTLRSNNIP